ncbi:MAG: hypothetical protein EPN93_13395 [Spirochaetes bacterium]|nr:MAG: hypothetical protein EPN93_13395 [Spirochaetota bacterium]
MKSISATPLLLMTSLLLACFAGTLPGDNSARCTVVTVGENLERHVGSCIEVTGTVSNTKYPSLGNYWITAFELEDYRGKTVTVTGIVEKRTESTDGGFTQGREGEYYHLKVKSVSVEKSVDR